MKEDALMLDEKVTIIQLTREFAIDLMKHSYFISAIQRGDVLNHGLRYRVLKAVKLIPRATRLVAYHTEEKKAVGFLYLEENNNWLYTIEYVFVDPKYRKMGLATGLLNYAMKLAKAKGAKKVNLNVDSNSTKAIDLYKKLGFEKIGCTLLVQGYLAGSTPSRLIKRVIVGQGCLNRLALERKGRMHEFKMNSRKNRDTLFGIYNRCVDQGWVDFFQVNPSNLINGSRHIWQPPFFRDVLINDLANSFVLIFNSPFSSKASMELYSTSEAVIPSVLKDVLKILSNRGVSFVQITLFNHSKNAPSSWFEKREMMKFHFVAMGKIL
jgi:ribosomal protein S18 acetylase RimI-like enzyme